jgi:hypothetical protein
MSAGKESNLFAAALALSFHCHAEGFHFLDEAVHHQKESFHYSLSHSQQSIESHSDDRYVDVFRQNDVQFKEAAVTSLDRTHERK